MHCQNGQPGLWLWDRLGFPDGLGRHGVPHVSQADCCHVQSLGADTHTSHALPHLLTARDNESTKSERCEYSIIFLLGIKGTQMTSTQDTPFCFKGTIQRASHMRVKSIYFCLNCKLYDGPIRLLADHDFTVRCIQVESIARSRWMVPLSPAFLLELTNTF